ncbi:Clp protease N-terminal domain-containing protein [Streptacidiphilus sp. PAMC 29251]
MTMMERFSTTARQAVVDAVEAARAEHAPALGEEHLLAGLLAQADSTAVRLLAASGCGPDQHAALLAECRDYRRRGGIGRAEAEALRGLGIEVDEIIDRVEEIWGEGALLEPVPLGSSGRRGRKRLLGSNPPWRPEAKKALETSLRQALDLRSKTIGSEHVLLGLLVSPGAAKEVLTGRGITSLHIRALIQTEPKPPAPPTRPPAPPTPPA